MKRNGVLASYFAVIAACLPGDRIHDVAPINKEKASSKVVVANIDAANAKRARKMAKRAAR